MNKYESAVEQIISECRKYDFADEIKELEEIKGRMEIFTVKIMFTGGFSAGKSAAVNIFLGEDVLSENQTPETAIACELVYDTDEYLEAVKGNTSTRFHVFEADKISPAEYDYVIRHINNEKVKSLNGFTIVDMPGFNSGIEAHNKAILRYAGRGNAYVLAIDCEDGEIKQSLSEFLNEIKNYDNNIAILITKVDKKDNSAIEKIVDNISSSASDIFFKDIKIATVSKFIDGSDEKIAELLSSFRACSH